MISLYSGTPGSGKSLHAAERIYHILRARLPVICNFDVNLDMVRGRGRKRQLGDFVYLSNDDLRPDFLIEYSRRYFSSHRFREELILLVIDEAQLMFNARSWDARDRAGWVSFFSQHRKYGYRIILIAQFDRMLDRQIRSLLEYEFVHRKVSNFGVWGKVFSVVAIGKLFVAVKIWYPLREKVGAEWYVAKKAYYRIYDTLGTFDSASSVGEGTQEASEAGSVGDVETLPGCGCDTVTQENLGKTARACVDRDDGEVINYKFLGHLLARC